tara:strand:- start:12796 stop:13092 length:297 start_codon:yes stop_codon:yes gene_type:complete
MENIMSDLQSELTRWTELQEKYIIAAQLAEEELEYEVLLTEAYYNEQSFTEEIPNTYDQWWDEEIATLQQTYPDMDINNPIEVRYFMEIHHPDTKLMD